MASVGQAALAGAGTGAAIGGAVSGPFAPIGAAVGAVGGALVGGISAYVENSPKRQYKKLLKEQLQTLQEGGGGLTEAEKDQAASHAQQLAGQQVGQQQRQLIRQSMAGGPVMSGALQQASRGLAGAPAEAAATTRMGSDQLSEQMRQRLEQSVMSGYAGLSGQAHETELNQAQNQAIAQQSTRDTLAGLEDAGVFDSLKTGGDGTQSSPAYIQGQPGLPNIAVID